MTEWMDEAQALGMKRLPSERNRELGTCSGPVGRIANDRVTDLGQVNADLVSSARLEPAFHHAGGLAKGLQYPEMGHRGNTQGRSARHSAPAVTSVAHQGHVDPARGSEKDPLDDSQVTALDGVSAKEGLERTQRAGVCDHQDHARRVLVEPMHDAHVKPFMPMF